MKRVLRDAASELFWRTGLSALARRFLVRGGRFVLELHGVAERHYDDLPRAAQPSFCSEQLRELLLFVGARFDWLSPDELLSGEKPGVLLTFDDGYANHAANALPLLEEHGVPAVFFITTRHVREPSDWLPAIRQAAELCPPDLIASRKRDLFDGMSSEALRDLASSPRLTVGSHTVTHPFLTDCDDRTLDFELAESKRFLEEITQRTVDLFAYPTGDYDRRVMEAVRRAGYRAAFAEKGRLGPRTEQSGRWEIPRVGLYAATPAYLSAKLSGLADPPLGREHRAAPR